MAALLVPFIALVVWLDSACATPGPQHWLALPTAAYLWAWSRRLSRSQARELWLCVAISGAFELLLTEGWGLYGYRFGFVPLYVFPGHGLLWLAAHEILSRPAWRRAETALCRAVGAAAVAWGAAGLARPWTSGLPPDVHGALYAPICLPLVLGSDRRLGYALTFLLTSALELYGTALGTWHWSAAIPTLGLPSGDPPTLIAGGYFIFAYLAREAAGRFCRLAACPPSSDTASTPSRISAPPLPGTAPRSTSAPATAASS